MKKLLLALPIAALSLAYVSSPYWSKDTYEVTVTDKMVKNDAYMIYTDKGSFTMKDSIAYFRFSTSDDYGKIKKGSKYTLQAYGWRVPFLSVYENIINQTESK